MPSISFLYAPLRFPKHNMYTQVYNNRYSDFYARHVAHVWLQGNIMPSASTIADQNWTNDMGRHMQNTYSQQTHEVTPDLNFMTCVHDQTQNKHPRSNRSQVLNLHLGSLYFQNYQQSLLILRGASNSASTVWWPIQLQIAQKEPLNFASNQSPNSLQHFYMYTQQRINGGQIKFNNHSAAHFVVRPASTFPFIVFQNPNEMDTPCAAWRWLLCIKCADATLVFVLPRDLSHWSPSSSRC